MKFKYFSANSKLTPIEKANIPLSSIEYSYGYGVYELLKIKNGILYFEKQHIERLLDSSAKLGIEHNFTHEQISKNIHDLIKNEEIISFNLKIILLGGRFLNDANLFIIPLSPLFLNRKYYKIGVKVCTYNFERLFPTAKTLNMLGSYLAFKKAREQNCYDALLINSNKIITEGTRSNFFAIKNKTIYTQSDDKILQGVTRKTVLYIAKNLGYSVEKRDIKINDLIKYDSYFLTSTSSKILPIKQIDDLVPIKISENLKLLMKDYDSFLASSKGVFNNLK